MALSTGTRIGPYEVTGTIGSGCMGEVYRAHDARLARDVALKVLPDAGPYFYNNGADLAGDGRTYDVSPDGRRFLTIKQNADTDESAAPPHLVVVQNWLEELKRLVPTN